MYLFISRKLIDTLPDDPFEAVLAIISEFRHAMSLVSEFPGDQEYRDRKQYQIAQEVCALLSVLLKREGFAIRPPQLADDPGTLAKKEKEETLAQVTRFLDKLESDIQFHQHLGRSEYLQQTFDAALGPPFCVEFSREDLRRLWGLLGSLRDLVHVSPDLEPAHRKRLLRRIDRLMGEFREKTYDLSVFWDFVVEIRLAFRPHSEDAQLSARTMKGLLAIVWPAQVRAFGRAPQTPLRFLDQDP